MRKLLYWMALVAALLVPVAAQYPTQPVVITQIFSAAGTSSALGVAGYTNHTITWSQVGTTTVTGCAVEVDSAPAATGPWTLGGLVTSQTCNTANTVTVTATVASWARINVTAITAGTVSVTYSAVNAAVSKSSGGNASVPNPLSTVAIYDKGGQVYNVRAYGSNSTCTNSGADDSTAINAAELAAFNGGGGQVYLPGPCTISHSLWGYPGVRLVGAGLYGTFIFANTALPASANMFQTVSLVQGTWQQQWNAGACQAVQGTVTVSNSGLTVTETSTANFDTDGSWNNATAQINGVLYTIASVTSTSVLTLSAGTPATNGAGQTFAGVYSGCPVEVTIENVHFSGNVAGRGTGAGNDIAIRGSRYRIYESAADNAPNDGFYSEMMANQSTPPYNGATAINYGNASWIYSLQTSNNTNAGIEYYGPSDTQTSGLISFYNGGWGGIFGCLAATAGGVCGVHVYLDNSHMYHNNMNNVSAGGTLITTPVMGKQMQAENQQNGGVGIQVTCANGGAGSNCGVLQANGVRVWINGGAGMVLDSPTAAFTAFGGNAITGLESFGNTGLGLQITANATRTVVVGPVLTNNTGGGISNSSTDASVVDGMFEANNSVADASFSRFKGLPQWTSVCDPSNSTYAKQSPIAGLGTSSNQQVYSCTIPTWCTQAGHVVDYKASVAHGGATGSIVYQFWWGGVGGTAIGNAVTTTDSGALFVQGQFAIQSATAATFYADNWVNGGATPSLVATSVTQGLAATVTAGVSEAFALSFNAGASTSDTVTPGEFFIRCST